MPKFIITDYLRYEIEADTVEQARDLFQEDSDYADFLDGITDFVEVG